MAGHSALLREIGDRNKLLQHLSLGWVVTIPRSPDQSLVSVSRLIHMNVTLGHIIRAKQVTLDLVTVRNGHRASGKSLELLKDKIQGWLLH